MAPPVLRIRPALIWQGRKAVDPNAPARLLIDAGGDALQIDSAGDFLAISPGVTWRGHGADDPTAEIDLAIDGDGDALEIGD